MKKVISTLLCVTTAATMAVGLSGCGGNEASSDTLLYYMFGDKPADLDTVMAAANEIIKEKIGVTVQMEYIDSASYSEKMKLKMAAGESYDLCHAGYNNVYQTAVEMGGLYDITDYLEEVNMSEVIPQFYLDSATVNGRIYGIPNIQVVSNPACFSISKEVAAELDIDMKAIQDAAWSFNDLESMKAYAALLDDAFAKLKAAYPDTFVLNPGTNFFINPRYEELHGGIGLLKDGSTTELVQLNKTEEWKFSVEKTREWYEKGYIRSDIASKGNSIVDEAEHKLYSVHTATYKPGQEPYDENRYGSEQEYVLLHKPYVGRTGPLATMTAVGANSKNPKKAVEYLKLINSDKELYNIICWGLEGKHYTKDAEGFVTEIENSGYKDVGKNAWRYGNQFNGLVMAGQPVDVWEKTEQMNNEAVKSPMLGFVPDTNPITNELANISNIGSEYKARTQFGTEPVETWIDGMYEKYKQAGIDKVQAELQKQYDEFLASK